EMVHLTHSSRHWKLRCINDSSDYENTPPNTQNNSITVPRTAPAAFVTRSRMTTSLPPEHRLLPGFSFRNQKYNLVGLSRDVQCPAPPMDAKTAPALTDCIAGTMPSQPHHFLACTPRDATGITCMHENKCETLAQPPLWDAAPSPSCCTVLSHASEGPTAWPSCGQPVGLHALEYSSKPPSNAWHTSDGIVPARRSSRVAHLREQFKPMATAFQNVPYVG
ncbi:hypothetical protein L917_14895, partial [Phytophthora nicotianae]